MLAQEMSWDRPGVRAVFDLRPKRGAILNDCLGWVIAAALSFVSARSALYRIFLQFCAVGGAVQVMLKERHYPTANHEPGNQFLNTTSYSNICLSSNRVGGTSFLSTEIIADCTPLLFQELFRGLLRG